MKRIFFSKKVIAFPAHFTTRQFVKPQAPLIHRFTRKNKAIRAFLKPAPSQEQEAIKYRQVLAAVQAIENISTLQKGNIPLILSVKYLDLLLIYAAHNNMFRSEQACLNAFQTFSYLQQFTKLQRYRWSEPLRKITRGAHHATETLSTNNIIDEVLTSFNYLGLPIPTYQKVVQVTKAINNLPPNENYFFKQPLNAPYRFHATGFSRMSHAVGRCPFFFIEILPNSRFSTLRIPSMSVFNCLLGLLPYKQNFYGAVITGRVGHNTRDNMHRHRLHPLPVTSRHVKSNYKAVHGLNCGPSLTFTHDMYHIFMASLLSPKEISFILDALIPHFRSLGEKTSCQNDRNNLYTFIAEALGEFDLENKDPSSYEALGQFLDFNTYVVSVIKDEIDGYDVRPTTKVMVKRSIRNFFNANAATHEANYGVTIDFN